MEICKKSLWNNWKVEYISLAWSVFNAWIVLLDHLDPTSLPEVEIGLSEDILEALMIGENVHLSAQQEMSPCDQCMNDGCQFQVMCRIVPLIRLQLLRGVSHNFLLLHQDSTETLQRSITKDLVWFGFVWRSEDWSSHELLLECIESHITLRRPNIFDMLLEKVRKWLANLGEVLNKSSTIAGQTEEASKLLDILRGLPVDNCFNLFRIYKDALGKDDVTEVKNFIKP